MPIEQSFKEKYPVMNSMFERKGFEFDDIALAVRTSIVGNPSCKAEFSLCFDLFRAKTSYVSLRESGQDTKEIEERIGGIETELTGVSGGKEISELHEALEELFVRFETQIADLIADSEETDDSGLAGTAIVDQTSRAFLDMAHYVESLCFDDVS